MRHGLVMVAGAATLALTFTSCSKSDPDTGSTTPEAATQTANVERAEPPKPEPEPKRRSELEEWRPLLDEVARAELDVGGPFIDFGDAATHKWVRGGWKNAWGSNRLDEEDGTSYTRINGSKSEIPFVVREGDDPLAEVVVRLRSECKGQKGSVRIDGKHLGDVEPTEEWQTFRVPVAESPEPGLHDVGFLLRKSCGKTRAEIDWLWLSREADADAPEIVDLSQPLDIGGAPLRALPAPQARSYAWHLMVPQRAELIFEYAAKSEGTKFIVTAQTDGEPVKTLFDEMAEDEWQEGVVDLAQFGEKAIRLELSTTGGEAAWGEVELMVPPRDPPEGIGQAKRPRNVVFILIDTVRADVFEPFGGEGSIVHTPAFDELTKESTVFSAAYMNENWTKPSVATVLTGLYPTTHDTKKDDSTLPDEVETISERLQDEGFKTAGFVANGYVSEKFGFEQGWDYFRNYIREGRNSSAENVYRDALEWVDEHGDEPYFLYVQTIDPHVPYRTREQTAQYLPDEKSSLGKMIGGRQLQELSKKDLSDVDIAWVKALYRGEVSYHDHHMGLFVDALKERGQFDDTLFVITNDHGEELKEHGRIGHGHTLYDELVRAPLLLRYPGRFPVGHRIDEPVEAVDFMPTILDLLELEPREVHEGFSLMPLVEGTPLQRPFYAVSEFLYGQRSVRVGRWKLITAANWTRLFDVAEDPTEQDDIADSALIGRRLCEIHLAEALANPNKRRRLLDGRVAGKQFNAGTVEMDSELKKQLEALGYFGDE